MNLSIATNSPVQSVETLLKTLVEPHAERIDQDPSCLQQTFEALGTHHLLGLKVEKQLGGQGWDSRQSYGYTEQLARYSGALVFLQSQHQRCVQELASSDNQALKEKYLQAAIAGRIGLGVGFSHLRRAQQPITATEKTDGYCFNGTVPWITGFGIFDHWMLAAQLPDGRSVFVLAPFQNVGNSLSFSEPMRLAALGSTQTVTATLDNWVAPKELVLDIKPAGWIQKSDRTYPLTHNFFALGCAQAGLDILEKAQTGTIPTVRNVYDQLHQEVLQCRTKTYNTLANPSSERIRLRAWAIDLAVRCAHAAVIVSRGAANFNHHPAQRVYREALAFSVSGQNTAIMEASLEQLLHR